MEAGGFNWECQQISSKIQCGLQVDVECSTGLAYGFRRCHDFDAEDKAGQDYVAVDRIGSIVIGIVADGVSQSYHGNVAAESVVCGLRSFLREGAAKQLTEEDIGAVLEKLAPEVQRKIEEISIGKELSPLLQQALAKTRLKGTQTVLGFFVFDMSAHSLYVCKVGDVTIKVLIEGGTVVPVESDPKARWSSTGDRRLEVHCQRWDRRGKVRGIIVHSDGLPQDWGERVLQAPHEDMQRIEEDFRDQANQSYYEDDLSFVVLKLLRDQRAQAWHRQSEQTNRHNQPEQAERHRESEQTIGQRRPERTNGQRRPERTRLFARSSEETHPEVEYKVPRHLALLCALVVGLLAVSAAYLLGRFPSQPVRTPAVLPSDLENSPAPARDRLLSLTALSVRPLQEDSQIETLTNEEGPELPQGADIGDSKPKKLFLLVEMHLPQIEVSSSAGVSYSTPLRCIVDADAPNGEKMNQLQLSLVVKARVEPETFRLLARNDGIPDGKKEPFYGFHEIHLDSTANPTIQESQFSRLTSEQYPKFPEFEDQVTEQEGELTALVRMNNYFEIQMVSLDSNGKSLFEAREELGCSSLFRVDGEQQLGELTEVTLRVPLAETLESSTLAQLTMPWPAESAVSNSARYLIEAELNSNELTKE